MDVVRNGHVAIYLLRRMQRSKRMKEMYVTEIRVFTLEINILEAALLSME